MELPYCLRMLSKARKQEPKSESAIFIVSTVDGELHDLELQEEGGLLAYPRAPRRIEVVWRTLLVSSPVSLLLVSRVPHL